MSTPSLPLRSRKRLFLAAGYASELVQAVRYSRLIALRLIERQALVVACRRLCPLAGIAHDIIESLEGWHCQRWQWRHRYWQRYWQRAKSAGFL